MIMSGPYDQNFIWMIYLKMAIYIKYVSLEHKSSHKQHRDICYIQLFVNLESEGAK